MNKKIYYDTDAQLEGIKYCAKVIDFGVSLSVASAFNELYTAHMMLREHRVLYRHEVKRFANAAIANATQCRARMLSAMRNRAFFDAYSDKVIDLAEHDIANFRFAIKQTLDDCRYPDSELAAYMETARVMLDMAHVHFDGVVRKAKEHAAYDYASAFSEFNCRDACLAWERTCQLLFNDPGRGCVDLNNEKCLAAYGIIERKFADGDYVEACMKEGLNVCPNFENPIIYK